MFARTRLLVLSTVQVGSIVALVLRTSASTPRQAVRARVMHPPVQAPVQVVYCTCIFMSSLYVSFGTVYSLNIMDWYMTVMHCALLLAMLLVSHC